MILYLIADAALALVLCRMMLTGLARRRPCEFILLHAWYAYAIVTQLAPSATWPHYAVWIFAAPALARAGRRITPTADLGFAIVALLGVASFCTQAIFAAWGPALTPLNLGCWFALAASAVFFYGAASTPDEEAADRILWRGLAAWFFLFGTGLQLVTALGSDFFYSALLVALAAAWFVFAWYLAPTPDALVNPAMLALARPFKFQISNFRFALRVRRARG